MIWYDVYVDILSESSEDLFFQFITMDFISPSSIDFKNSDALFIFSTLNEDMFGILAL